MIRFNRDHPCPICDGHQQMVQGHGSRCYGFIGDDGQYARCTRSEHAADAPYDDASAAYVHYLAGPCNCGADHSNGGLRVEQPRIEPAQQRRDDAERIRRAVDRYNEAEPAGERVAQYLRHRGLSGQIPDDWRYAPHTPHPHFDQDFPSIVMPFRDVRGKVTAVQHIYLDPESEGKLSDHPDYGDATSKLFFGRVKGTAIRLGDFIGHTLILAEGPETTIAIHEATGNMAWVVGGKAGFANVVLPPAVKRVIIAADHDQNGAGQEAAERAAHKFQEQGIAVTVALPPTVGDFLDLFNAEGAEAVETVITNATSVTTDSNTTDNILKLVVSHDTPVGSRDPDDEDEADDGGRPSAATQIVRLVLGEGAELFHAPDGQAYMTIQIDGVAQTMPVKKTSTFIKRLYYEATDKAANSQAVTDAKGVLEGKALYGGEEIPVHTRLASANGNLYLDLGRGDWLIIEIGPQGWRVIPAAGAPVRFLHPRGLTALPLPLPGGDLADLRALLHLKSEDDWRRLVGVLVACMNPDIEQPVILFAGEPGASKTTTAERLKALIDPAVPALKSEPRNEDTLAIQARNGWLLGYDNLSHCPDWLSDAICRVSTGGGLSKRELYSDDDEIIFDIRRPVMLTSIVDVVTRSDLADRAFTISLVQIPEDQRRPKQEIDAEFEAMQPKLLGALLDICAGALKRLPETHLARSPRMAGIARWVTAAEEGLGWAPGTFVMVMQNSKEESFDAVIEASILAAVVLDAVEAGRTWDEVTAGALLSDLRVCAGEGISRRKDFPKNAGSLSGKLRTLSPALRSKGISIESGQTANTGSRKVWTIRKYCAKSDARDASDAEPMNTALSSVAPASISVAPEIESDAQNLNGDGGSVDSVDSVAVSAPLSSEGGGNGAAPRTEVRI